MMPKESLTRARLKTPRAAAIAGMVFSVLLIIVFSALRISVPNDPLESGEWLKTNTTIVALALNLIPFAGIAFLWLIGVLRDRLGDLEDRFFATVFLGSGFLFLAMLFAMAAVAGAIILAFAAEPEAAIDSATFHFARTLAYNLMNIYVVKMAGVFMISTSTLAVFTEIAPRWIAFLGYGLSLFLLFGSSFFGWSFVAFPLWVFLISGYILVDQLRRPFRVQAERPRKGP